ncbi:Elongation Factor 1-Beta [Manis pentadactyla]|nr:Elongation Factor 1-Beta [Manis pentadactyla]
MPWILEPEKPCWLQVLNNYPADKSYMGEYVPAQADAASYEKEKARLSGLKKALGKYGPANVEGTTVSGATDSKDENDSDLFGAEEEEGSEEAKKLKEECFAHYESRKAKKPTLVAKSSIFSDVKPWDDKTGMAKLAECVRSSQADGFVWGSPKLVPVGGTAKQKAEKSLAGIIPNVTPRVDKKNVNALPWLLFLLVTE